jgi:hypothetical protein
LPLTITLVCFFRVGNEEKLFLKLMLTAFFNPSPLSPMKKIELLHPANPIKF